MSYINQCIFTIIVALATSSSLLVTAQSGFNKIISDHSESFDNINIDDIIFYDHQLLVRGNIYDDSLGLLGLFVASLDTTGHLLWHQTYLDSTKESHYITNTPTRFRISYDKEIHFPNKFWNLNQLALTTLDIEGNERFTKKYLHDGKTIFPGDVIKVKDEIYLFGFVQRNDFKGDCYILKTDSLGNMIWLNYYGLQNHEEWFGGVIQSSDSTFTISSNRFSKDFYLSDSSLVGWWSPWLFTVDFDGNIVREWLGEENDTTTLAGGPIYPMPNGDYTLVSRDFDIVDDEGEYHLFFKPTITRLDSDFRMIWKKDLIDYFWPANRIVDIVYDTLRDEFVLGGVKTVIYTDEHSEHEIWTTKLDGEGNTMWDITDTIHSEKYAFHETAGLEISSSGSIYVAGHVYYNNGPSQGWILKVTPDGCSDTLCSTTSIAEQIRNWDKNVTLYPNPVKNELNIKIKQLDRDAYVQLSNIQGKVLLQEEVVKGVNRFDLDLMSGIYICTIISDNKLIHSEKVVVY